MKFYIETYGCQMNVADSEMVSSLLINSGHTPVTDIGLAEVIIFNTCSVRQHAEQRVLGRIANEKHRKVNNPHLRIGVIGCMAQRMGKRLLQTEPGIDFVVGVDQYNLLSDILLDPDKVGDEAIEMDSSQVYRSILPDRGNKHCAYVTVMRGCDNFCSYCIVPYVRGRERSRPMEDIFNEVRAAADSGCHDITLLGQNVNSYKYQGIDFPALLLKLNEIDSLWRLRFVTSHPKDLSDRLIDAMAENSKVCEHIHLPLQSGDNDVLKLMNRAYTAEHYLDKVEKLRQAIPDVAITTDLMVGFPSETDAQFENTLNIMKEVQFDYSFCFKYSCRDGTAAADFDGQIDEAVRLHRLQTMIDLQREITLKKFQAKIGKVVEVYVEDISKKSTKQVSGKTRDFKIAVLSGDAEQIGKLMKAKVVSATAGTLICQ